MNSKHRLVGAIALFGAAFVFAADVISTHAGGLTFDAAGNLFVADGHSVSKFTVDGTKSTFATALKEPLGLSFDSKGNLFVSDLGSNSIYKFTPEGKKSTFASGISSVGMAFDRSGNLFVSHDDSIFKLRDAECKVTSPSQTQRISRLPVKNQSQHQKNLHELSQEKWINELKRDLKFRVVNRSRGDREPEKALRELPEPINGRRRSYWGLLTGDERPWRVEHVNGWSSP